MMATKGFRLQAILLGALVIVVGTPLLLSIVTSLSGLPGPVWALLLFVALLLPAFTGGYVAAAKAPGGERSHAIGAAGLAMLPGLGSLFARDTAQLPADVTPGSFAVGLCGAMIVIVLVALGGAEVRARRKPSPASEPEKSPPEL